LELEWSFTTSWGRNWTLAPTKALALAKELARIEATVELQREDQILCGKSNVDIAKILSTLQTKSISVTPPSREIT
jgi:hypothetical protein